VLPKRNNNPRAFLSGKTCKHTGTTFMSVSLDELDKLLDISHDITLFTIEVIDKERCTKGFVHLSMSKANKSRLFTINSHGEREVKRTVRLQLNIPELKE
tara:strand:+ start:29736 stop:30035 length:300 start_codon:yes stop_codon:yes gene_type:complete